MSSSEAQDLNDITIHSRRTVMRGVRAPNVEMRPWLRSFPVCVALTHYHIIHVGFQETAHPMRVIRARQTSTYFLACHEGKGQVLIDGRWRVCEEGFACLLPAHTLNGLEAIQGSPWNFCWVCYQRPVEQRPVADASAPVLARFDASPLRSAILGLMHECNGPAEPRLMQHWTDLVHSYVMRFAQPSDQPDELRLLWERVLGQLNEHWTLARLAREAGYSNEHLRRLCQRQLGRSPMHQVTYLRMRRAAELLSTTELTVESIANDVGYNNPFVFSNAFTKWLGSRPSEYRRKRAAAKTVAHARESA